MFEVVGNALVDEMANSDEIVVVGFAPEVIHHHLNGVDRCNGVDLVFSSVFGSRPVDGFKERMFVANVPGSRHAHAALENSSKVRRDVAKHV